MAWADQRFSSGAFARYFGISKDTLLYYDKIGLFRPAGVQPNGYRYYTASQIRPMGTLLSLREMNVPIARVRRYFEHPSPQGLVEMARGQIRQIDSEMARLAAARQLFSQLVADTREAMDAPAGQVQIRRLGPAWFRYGRPVSYPDVTGDAQWMDLLKGFLEETGAPGAAPVGSLLALKDLQQGHFSRVERLFLPAEPGEGVRRPGGMFAVLYHRGEYDSLGGAYLRLTAQLAAAGWQLDGDAYEEYLVADLATEDPSQYITRVTVRVKRRNGEEMQEENHSAGPAE